MGTSTTNPVRRWTVDPDPTPGTHQPWPAGTFRPRIRRSETRPLCSDCSRNSSPRDKPSGTQSVLDSSTASPHDTRMLRRTARRLRLRPQPASWAYGPGRLGLSVTTGHFRCAARPIQRNSTHLHQPSTKDQLPNERSRHLEQPRPNLPTDKADPPPPKTDTSNPKPTKSPPSHLLHRVESSIRPYAQVGLTHTLGAANGRAEIQVGVGRAGMVVLRPGRSRGVKERR